MNEGTEIDPKTIGILLNWCNNELISEGSEPITENELKDNTKLLSELTTCYNDGVLTEVTFDTLIWDHTSIVP